MKEEINELYSLALLQILNMWHEVTWCLRAALNWSGCGKAKGRFRVRMWPGDPVLLTTWPWDPWCPFLQGPPRASVFYFCNEKVGLWHPTSCCHPQLVYEWRGMTPFPRVPPPGSHCLHASLPTTLLAFFYHFFSLYFLHHFSPLVTVLFLPPWASTNPRVLQHGNIRRMMGVWPQSLISPLFN